MSTERETAIPKVLERNLRALAARDVELVKRLVLPASSAHVSVPESGPPLYRLHRQWLPFAVEDGELEASVAGIDGAERVLVFGVALGEQVAHIVKTLPAVSIVAWERDPWLLRLALKTHDFTAAITAGRLRFLLGVDLVSEPALAERALLPHPFLARVYAPELHLLQSPPGERRAIVGLGGLFVDDLVDGLRERGYGVLPVDFEGWAKEELAHAALTFRPALVATINYTPGLAEFCHASGCPLLVWEIDPATDRLGPCATPTDDAHVFTYRAAHVAEFRAAGFRHVEYLPLAANVARRRPLALAGEELSRYAAPVCFVGASMVAQALEYRRTFVGLFAEWRRGDPDAAGRCDAVLQELLDAQLASPERYVLPELLEERFAEFLAAARRSELREDLVRLIGEVAAAEKRLAYVSALGAHGIHVWGDEHWKSAEPYGVRYRGPAGHRAELSRVYSGARVHVDVGRIYQSDIVTMRVFDVLACGGFLIAEHSPALEQLFDVGRELEAYRTLDELQAKVAHYLAHPAEARAIAERGLAAVRERHTFAGRLDHMLAAVGTVRPGVPV